MSEFSKSQRMSWDNDGMDPDWKPEPSAPRKSEALSKLERLIRACEPLAEAVKNIPKDELIGTTLTVHSYSVSAKANTWVELREAFEEVKLK